MKKLVYIIASILLVLVMQISVYADDADTADCDSVEITYVSDGSITTVSYDVGEIVSPIEAEQKNGYMFEHWINDTGEVYDFSNPLCESVTLHATYTLLPAVCYIEDVSFVYDGNERYLAPKGLYHSLAELGGYYTFEWYKGEDLVSISDTVRVKNASDTGKYSCTVTFHYGNDIVVTYFDGIDVLVEKCTVSVPEISAEVYSGELCTPNIIESELYTYDAIYPISAGKYDIKLTLTDAENYKWDGSEDLSAISVFEVLKAPNKFIGKINVFDIYYGADDEFSANSKFGNVVFLYSKDSSSGFSTARPSGLGSYYAKAVVEESDNYFGIESNAIPFKILSYAPVPDNTDGDRWLTPTILFLLILACASIALIILLMRLVRAARVKPVTTGSVRRSIGSIEMMDDDLDSGFSIQLTADSNDYSATLTRIDKDKADELISDSLARSLLRRERACIKTVGCGKVRMSLGVLNDNFNDGDRVDINVLKEKGLISTECGYLEIVGEGTLSKRLSVYANEFTLSAIKMIALCSGESVKVGTLRKKGKKY